MTLLNNNAILKKELSTAINEEEEAYLLLNYCCINKIRRWKECQAIAQHALEISQKINFQEGVGLAYLEIGYQHWFSDEFEIAYEFLDKSVNILISTNNYFKYGRALAVKSSILWSKGERKKATDDIFKGLEHIEKSNNPLNSLWLEWFLGIFYFDLKHYENSEKQYLKALDIIKKSPENTTDAYAYCIIGYGGVLLKTDREFEALDYFLRAQTFCYKEGLWMQEARVLQDLGNYYKKRGDNLSAKKYFYKSYSIRKKQNTKPALISSILAIAELDKINNLNSALKYAEEALDLSKVIKATQKIKSCHILISEIYRDLNDISLSNFHLEEAEKIED